MSARIGASVVATAAVAAMLSFSMAPASATVCPNTWGSLNKVTTTVNFPGTLTGVRSGTHDCYDRVVLDVSGPASGYRVGYVSSFSQVGSGTPVAARGGAKLQVSVDTPAYDQHGRATYRPANVRELIPTAGKPTLRQAVWLGSFEGQSDIGLGVRARLPFRVFVLDGPGSGSRLVIDIAHHW